jgi:hypothetical protein
MLTGRAQASAMSSQSPCLALCSDKVARLVLRVDARKNRRVIENDITQLLFGFHLGAYERFGNHQAKIQDSVSFPLSLHQGDADMP